MSIPDRVAASSPGDVPFEFGKNWSRFLATLNEDRIAAAVRSMQTLLHQESLQQRRFLDAGSGSGLFSLAAHRLGAEVTSFDVDQNSVACTQSLQHRFGTNGSTWNVLSGSLTDRQFLSSLGEFDVVYCWGVAHHTGSMWVSIDNLLPLVKPQGQIVLAIYNDQLYVSKIWTGVKRIYHSLPRPLRPIYVAAIGAGTLLKRLLIDFLAACLRLVQLKNPLVPFLNWARESRSRGMHAWHDLVDWVGGWPFEVAKPEDVFRFLRDRGFMLQELATTAGGHGCNEFVFVRISGNPDRQHRTA